MDLGSIVGLIAGVALLLVAMAMGGSITMFINPPGLLIVLGGTLAATLISQPMKVFLGSLRVGMNALFDRTPSVIETTETLHQFAQRVRREDLLSLENEEIEDLFLARGVRLAVDGVPADVIRRTLEDEMRALRLRHEVAQGFFRFIATTAPAMGMIGTLIGLIQMLQALDDPASIGPAMAVAMLTTLYGVILAFLVFGPIADKLESRTRIEAIHMRLVVEGIESIVRGENAMITREKLDAFLDPDVRGSDVED